MTTITAHQRKNLRTLRDFLRTLPAGSLNFYMGNYQNAGSRSSSQEANNIPLDPNVCGSSACAIGWGPTAGVRTMSKDWGCWSRYAERVFGSSDGDGGVGEYMFGQENPHCPHLAADRIDDVLKGDWR